MSNLNIFIISRYFEISQIQGWWFQITKQFLFKILNQKYPNKASLNKNTQKYHSWFQILDFLCLHKFLQKDVFSGADFKFYNSFSKILAQKYPNKTFLVKNPLNGIFNPKFKHFCFFTKFCIYTNLKVVISNMTIIF